MAFKPDIDDLRESPALDITKALASNPAYQILAVEPNIEALPPVLENRNNVRLASISDAMQQADIVLVLVKHKPFIGLQASDFSRAKLLDFVNI
ncbi:UDP-N-acetyl-D-mannosamine dehydrogenase [compost metagenome]